MTVTANGFSFAFHDDFRLDCMTEFAPLYLLTIFQSAEIKDSVVVVLNFCEAFTAFADISGTASTDNVSVRMKLDNGIFTVEHDDDFRHISGKITTVAFSLKEADAESVMRTKLKVLHIS